MTAAVALVSAHSGAGPAQAEEETLAGRERAVRLLIGNMLVYAKPDHAGEETGVYFRLDGTGLAATRNGSDTGTPRPIRWALLSDGQFCITGIDRKPGDGDCAVLSIDGDVTKLQPAAGPEWAARRLIGDAWNLDPATRHQDARSGKAAIDALVGNTLVLIPMGGKRETAALYLLADGTVRRASNEQPDFSNWVLQPEEHWSARGKDDLCISGKVGEPVYCAAVSVAGDLVTLRHQQAGLHFGNLLRGDARNLSSAASAAVERTRRALIGHTLRFQRPDRPAGRQDVALYFGKDGGGRIMAADKDVAPASRPIQWLLRLDGTLCVAEGRVSFRDFNCHALSIDGDSVTIIGEDGKDRDKVTIPGRLTKGNTLEK